MIITLIDKIRNRQSENSLTRRKESRRMEEVLTTEDIARDILRTSYKLLKRYDDSIEKDDKEKYLQYAPQVFEMCADFQNQF